MTDCGRPTKAGSPCMNRTVGLGHGLIRSCTTHKTEADVALMELLDKAYERGRERERDHLEFTMKIELDRERRAMHEKFKEDSRVVDPSYRTRTRDGEQIVEVKGYAYVWDGDTDLKVGDRVKLPGNEWNRSGWEGTVSALGSTYFGRMARVFAVCKVG